MIALAPGSLVRTVAPGALPLYGRVRAAQCPPGLVYVRLTADHARGLKGQCVYVRATSVQLRRAGRHASGVCHWGPRWLRAWRRSR